MKILMIIYVFVFGCVYSLSAKQQPSVKDCVKHPIIIKTKQPALPEKTKGLPTDKIVKTSPILPHFSMFNFFNFFYTKDMLDKIKVM